MLAVRVGLTKHLKQPSWLSSPSPSATSRTQPYSSSQTPVIEPSIDVAAFQTSLTNLAPSISKSLTTNGYYSTPAPYSVLPENSIRLMRQQSIRLRDQGRFQQSWSERIDPSGRVTRFDKPGVLACEPDGGDYGDAPDLVLYASALLRTLPGLLNSAAGGGGHGLSASSFCAKLAVTSPGGSAYPLHIDNPRGVSAGDTRRLTCIVYMNPDYRVGDGGELRIFCGEPGRGDPVGGETREGGGVVDITPDGGRMILFWSDEIPHEVLPTAPNADVSEFEYDRYALTVWIPTEKYHTIHDPNSKFAKLGEDAFPSKS